MGLSIIKYSYTGDYTTKPLAPNPDPKNWEIMFSVQYGDYVVAQIRYPDCTNSEGKKILVYKSNFLELSNQNILDPHFGDVPGFIYPIARFKPDQEGWMDACDFAKNKNSKCT